MNGSGAAWAAISFVNALPTGIGAAASISLSVRAEVKVQPSSGEVGSLDIPEDIDTPLVRRCVLDALRRFEPGDPFDLSLRLDSAIPPGRGLKSSSAVAVAIVRAVGAAVRRSVSPDQAAEFAAEVGSAVGVSATGAFDDAMAASLGGFVVADTTARRVLRHDQADADWKVVLWIPHASHRPSPEWQEAFRARSAEARGAVDSAKVGRYLVAIDRNTELVERVMGYEYRPLRRELRRRGALASGVSGMGPTLAAIVPERSRSEVARAMPAGEGEVLSVEFTPPMSRPPTGGIA